MRGERREERRERREERGERRRGDANLFPHAFLFVSRTLIVGFVHPVVDLLLPVVG